MSAFDLWSISADLLTGLFTFEGLSTKLNGTGSMSKMDTVNNSRLYVASPHLMFFKYVITSECSQLCSHLVADSFWPDLMLHESGVFVT